MNMKMIVAIIALAGSTSLASAQNNSPGAVTDQESNTTPSECMNMDIPVDQLSEECKNERAMMQNQGDGTTTGSTTVLPESTTEGTGGDPDTSSNRNDSQGAVQQ